MVAMSSESSCGTFHSPAPRSASLRFAMVSGSRLNALQKEVLAPMTSTFSSSSSKGAFDEATRAMARLVAVSVRSAVASPISALHDKSGRGHDALGAERLLDQDMPGHPYHDLT